MGGRGGAPRTNLATAVAQAAARAQTPVAPVTPKPSARADIGQLANQLRGMESAAKARELIAELTSDELAKLGAAVGLVGKAKNKKEWRNEIVYRTVTGPKTLGAAVQGEVTRKGRG
jgi:hypothetical protein